MSQLWHLESDAEAVGLECREVGKHLESLSLAQEALDEEIAKYNKLVTSIQTKISSFVTLIRQKQATIANYNKKIYLITASTGVRDFDCLCGI